jgi:hypothetical protein
VTTFLDHVSLALKGLRVLGSSFIPILITDPLDGAIAIPRKSVVRVSIRHNRLNH